MSKSVILILVIMGFVGMVVAFIAYRIARFLRGSVKISLPRTSYQSGESVSGSLELHTKKLIASNKLTVSLIGVETSRTDHNGKQQTHTREIYRDEVLIEDARTYPSGHQSRYDFRISVPDVGQPAFLNSGLGQALATAARIFGNTRTTLRWRIEARLDARGVDLATTKPIVISNRMGTAGWSVHSAR